MNRLALALILALVVGCEDRYYSAPKSSCTKVWTGQWKMVTKEKRDSKTGNKTTTTKRKHQYEFNCRWREYD